MVSCWPPRYTGKGCLSFPKGDCNSGYYKSCDYSNFLIADWCSEGEMAVGQRHFDCISIDLRVRVFRGPNREFIQLQRRRDAR